MKKTYVYLHHQGFDFYLADRELSFEERYCQICDEEDVLVGVYESEDSLSEKMEQLLKDGYEILPLG